MNNFYKYSIGDINCIGLKDGNKQCNIESEIRFTRKIQFIDLKEILNKNDSKIANDALELLKKENTMDVNNIVDIFNQQPLQSLSFVVNSSTLTSLSDIKNICTMERK